MRNKNINQFNMLPIAAAVMLMCGSAWAEDDIQELITPDSSISAGVGAINNAKDAKRFSQYTGLNQNASVLLDFTYNKRDAESGFWTKFSGRNLGLDTREINLSQSKQGDWKVALDYNEIVRRDPYTIHTGMTGIGTTTPTINLIAFPTLGVGGGVPTVAGTVTPIGAGNTGNPNGYKLPVAPAPANDVELKLKRTAIGVSGEKWLTPELQVELSFRNEDKKGARMFGRAGLDSADMLLRPNAVGTSANGGWAVLLTPEPINSTTQLLEGRLNFNRDALAVTAGYFGSFYINHNTSMSPNVPGILNRGALWTNCATAGCSSVQALASSPIDLPPDNQAHQVYLSGNYAFSDTTRSNFKLSFTHATQNQAFSGVNLTPTNPALTSLNGVVDTTLVQWGLSMRPLKELSVNASFRYEDRADKTPVAVYNTNGITAINPITGAANALNGTTNWPSGSQTRTSAKLDGIYRLPAGYSVMLGGDWEHKVTPLPPANTSLFNNQVFFRPMLNEYGVHAELRKAMSETLNGAIGFELKQRRGKDTDWVTAAGTAGNPLTNFIMPAQLIPVTLGNFVLSDMYMDRDRTKLRGNLDWQATDKMSIEAVAEHTQDAYLRAAPSPAVVQVVPMIAGARTIIGDSLSLDATYMATEDWRINGFWTRSYNRWNVNKINIGDDTRNNTDTVGFVVSGKATSRLTIGMDVLVTQDKTTFKNQSATAVAGQAAGNIVGMTAALPGNFLPNINYKTNKLNLHAKYDVDKMSSVQALFSYQQFRTDDWQWGYNGTPFLYSDNTTVSQPMVQNLKYLSVSYMLKF